MRIVGFISSCKMRSSLLIIIIRNIHTFKTSSWSSNNPDTVVMNLGLPFANVLEKCSLFKSYIDKDVLVKRPCYLYLVKWSTGLKCSTLCMTHFTLQESQARLDRVVSSSSGARNEDSESQLGLELRVQHLHGRLESEPAQRQAVQQRRTRARGPGALHWGATILPQGCQVIKHLGVLDLVTSLSPSITEIEHWYTT